MEERMSDRYELYLLHLLLGVAYEEASDLAKFGIPPAGVGHVAPLKKELQEKILPPFLEINNVVNDACVKMIEESVSGAVDGSDATQWMKTITHALTMRSSLLLRAYGNEMEKVRGLLDEIDRLLDESRKSSGSGTGSPSAEGVRR
jgi:hypothetical protein